MIKVVVVEDEWVLRKGLISSIDWAALGCAVVGEAENGKDGLEMIVRERPDIVITDIRMPVMDGLEMLDAAQKQCRFRSVILTSYSEFAYAKQAISLQVVDYILKPVDECVFYDLLLRLTDQIKQETLRDRLEKHVHLSELSVETDVAALHMADRPSGNYYVDEALLEIRKNYAQKISIEHLADRLEVSASYLSRKFKETTSYSFLDFLNQYRVTKAVQLLGTGQYRYGEVADMTGFTSHKHFYSVFRKYTNMSPSEFVKQKGLIIVSSQEAKD